MSSDSQALAPASSRLVERIALRLTLPAVLLAVPILIFLAIFFFYPAINLLFFSLLTQDAKGVVGPPHTLAHYTRFFEVDLYLRVFWNTLRISLVTSAFAIVLGYPVAIVMVAQWPDRVAHHRPDRHRALDRERRRALLRLAADPRQRAGRAAELGADVARPHQTSRSPSSIPRPPSSSARCTSSCR